MGLQYQEEGEGAWLGQVTAIKIQRNVSLRGRIDWNFVILGSGGRKYLDSFKGAGVGLLRTRERLLGYFGSRGSVPSSSSGVRLTVRGFQGVCDRAALRPAGVFYLLSDEPASVSP